MNKINKAPVLTSENYGINYFDFDENLLKFEKITNLNFEIKNQNTDEIKIEEISKNDKISNNLAENIEKISKKHCIFAKKVTIFKNTSKPLILDFEKIEQSAYMLFETNENIFAQIVIKNNLKNFATFINTIKIVANKNSRVEIVVLNMAKNSNANLLSFETEQKENSSINFTVVEFSSNNSVHNIKFNLIGDLSNANINTFYFGEEKQKLGLNYAINMSGNKCESKINALGLLFDESQKNFVGTINFNRGATKSVGEENEFCFVFSNKVQAKSTPILLSKEDDANGKHSTSVQNIDPKQMFYANARGLSKNTATKIFVEAKINKFLQNIFCDEIKSSISELIARRFKND